MAVNLSLNQSANVPVTMEPSVIIAHVLPLAILTLGIFLYGYIIFKFYKYLARRDLVKLKLDINKPMALKIFVYLLNQLVIVPVLIFIWFLVMACILIMMSNSTGAYIMFVSMATIAAIRISSYYNESLAEDLAKLLPLTLMAVFILEMNFSEVASKVMTVKEMFGYLDKLLFYLVFAVVVELVMRIQQIIRDVLEIRKHNLNASSSSKDEKKYFNEILDSSFRELAKMKGAELTDKIKIKKEPKQEKKYNDDAAL